MRNKTVTVDGVICRYDVNLNLVKTRLGCEIDCSLSNGGPGMEFYKDFKGENLYFCEPQGEDDDFTCISVPEEFMETAVLGPTKHTDINGSGYVFGPLFETGYIPGTFVQGDKIEMFVLCDFGPIVIFETEITGETAGATIYVHLDEDGYVDSFIIDDGWVF